MSYQVPQTRIFQTFGESVAINASTLPPVIVAPYYDVFDNIKMGKFEGSESPFPYEGFSGDDRIMEDDLDNTFKVVIRNAQAKGYPAVTYNGTAGNKGYIGPDKKSLFVGMVVADGGNFVVPPGFPELAIGDAVVQYKSGAVVDVFHIVGFQPASVTAPYVGIPFFTTAAEHSEADVTPTVDSANFDPSSNGLLEVVISTGGTTGTETTVTANITLNGSPLQTAVTCSNSVVTGIAGLTLAFADDVAWNSGDRIAIGIGAKAEADEQYNQGYATVILDKQVDTDTAPSSSFVLCYSAGDVVNPNGAEWDTTGLHLDASLSKNGMTILAGDVYGTYRIRKNEFSEKVYFVNTPNELKRLVGEAHPLNPLSMMCSLAMRNGDGVGVGFVAVEFDNLASYNKAYDAIGMDNQCWAIVPYDETEAIQRKAFSRILEFSGPSVMNWKTGWFGFDVPDTETIIESLTVTIGNASDSDLSQNLYVSAGTDISNVRYGDTVVIGEDQYAVLGVFTAVADPYIRIDTALPKGTENGVKVISKIDAYEKAEKVAAYAKSYNNERVRVFFADLPYLVDFPEAECRMSYLAAAWAGKRAGSAPHQPLTRSSIEGISCRGNGGFTVDDFNNMADDGVWLTVTDNDGITYCRHQLTTKESDENYNFKEDSKVANADEISMTIRAGLDNYYGRANVTDAALEVIRLKAEQVVLNIQSRLWPDILGPQITDVESITIERDTQFSDRVNLHIILNTPNPLNNLDIYLTIK